MAPAPDATRMFTTGRRLLNNITTFMGCCKKVKSKCSGNGVLMKTGFDNDEEEKGRYLSDDEDKPENEKQLNCGIKDYESVMLPFLERRFEKEDEELKCEETFLDFTVLPFAAAKKTEEEAAAADAKKAEEEAAAAAENTPVERLQDEYGLNKYNSGETPR